MNRSEIGKRGEDAAAKYLEDAGYEIVCRNYRAGHLETDIIAEDAERIIFCEVKARSEKSAGFLRPAAAVNAKKSGNLIRCAEEYIRQKRALGDDAKKPRIDVIEVVFSGDDVKINHIKNAVIEKRNV